MGELDVIEKDRKKKITLTVKGSANVITYADVFKSFAASRVMFCETPLISADEQAYKNGGFSLVARERIVH